MLSDARVGTAIPCSDFERAKGWYKEKIGFSPSEETPEGATYMCAEGTDFFLFPSSGKASGDHTQMAFAVTDVVAEVAELKKVGVTFEEYDFPGMKTVDGIVDMGGGRGAWFKDSEGNLIAIFESAAS